MNNKQRIDILDIAKFIGIVLVIIGHRSSGHLHSFIYSFHIPLFFIISGIVMKNDNNKSFLSNILEENRLLIYYLLFSSLYILYQFISDLLFSVDLISYNLIKNIFLTFSFYGIEEMWFLGSLFLGKCIVKKIVRFNYQKRIIISLILYVVSFVSINFISKIQLDNILYLCLFYFLSSILRACLISTFIYIGFECKDIILKNITKDIYIPYLILSITISFAVLYVFIDFQIIDYHLLLIGKFGLNIITAVVGTTLCLCISYFISKIPFFSFLKNIGRNTLFIMFLEFFKIDKTVYRLLLKNGISNYSISIFIYIIIILLSITILLPHINQLVIKTSNRLFTKQKS